MIKFLTTLQIVLLSFAAHASDLSKLSLQEVYALPVETVEEALIARDKPECEHLISSFKQGEDDPAKLSPAEFCAVQNYSNSRFDINRPLWETDSSGSRLNGNDWAYVRVLDAALSKMKPEPQTVVYRGTSRAGLKLSKKGEIVRLKGYTSTTPNREVAEGFIRDRLMVIKTVSGRNIKPYSNMGLEDELLLPRSLRVRFDRAEIKELELFSDEGPQKRKIEIVYLTEVSK